MARRETRHKSANHVRLCVVMLSGLGDVILGLPVVNALKRHDPHCQVTWVVEPMPSAILRHHPAVDDIVVYHKRPALDGALALWRDLRERRFEVTLNFNIYLKGIPSTVFSRAPLRVGFARPRSRDLAWLAVNRHVVPRRPQHFVDDFLQFLEPLDISPPITPEWRLRFTAVERAAQHGFFSRLGGQPVATIIPASGRPGKDWPAERWAQVAERLDRNHGFRVVLAGGPGAREGALAREIAAFRWRGRSDVRAGQCLSSCPSFSRNSRRSQMSFRHSAVEGNASFPSQAASSKSLSINERSCTTDTSKTETEPLPWTHFVTLSLPQTSATPI